MRHVDVCLVIFIVEAPSLTYYPPPFMTGKKGDSITLRCRATGTPSPTLTWYKEGTILRNERRFLITGETIQVTTYVYEKLYHLFIILYIDIRLYID